jgi:hypothetical protein
VIAQLIDRQAALLELSVSTLGDQPDDLHDGYARAF